MPLEINRVIPTIDQFASQQIGEQELLAVLLEAESRQDWRFALDGNRLQIRGNDETIVFVFDQRSNTYTTEKSDIPKLQESDFRPLLQKVKSNNRVIGISGPARKPIDAVYVDEQLRRIYSQFSPENTVILTGGYPGGVPYEAQQIAVEMSFDVIAVVPQVIYQPYFLDFPKSFMVTVTRGKNWGDETPYFARLIDELYVFEGGGPWTDLEIKMTNELGTPITLVPQRDRQSIQN